MEKNKSNRGGAREGAGRKAKGNIYMPFRVNDRCSTRVRELAKQRGLSLGEVLELLIDCYDSARLPE